MGKPVLLDQNGGRLWGIIEPWLLIFSIAGLLYLVYDGWKRYQPFKKSVTEKEQRGYALYFAYCIVYLFFLGVLLISLDAVGYPSDGVRTTAFFAFGAYVIFITTTISMANRGYMCQFMHQIGIVYTGRAQITRTVRNNDNTVTTEMVDNVEESSKAKRYCLYGNILVGVVTGILILFSIGNVDSGLKTVAIVFFWWTFILTIHTKYVGHVCPCTCLMCCCFGAEAPSYLWYLIYWPFANIWFGLYCVMASIMVIFAGGNLHVDTKRNITGTGIGISVATIFRRVTTICIVIACFQSPEHHNAWLLPSLGMLDLFLLVFPELIVNLWVIQNLSIQPPLIVKLTGFTSHWLAVKRWNGNKHIIKSYRFVVLLLHSLCDSTTLGVELCIFYLEILDRDFNVTTAGFIYGIPLTFIMFCVQLGNIVREFFYNFERDENNNVISSGGKKESIAIPINSSPENENDMSLKDENMEKDNENNGLKTVFETSELENDKEIGLLNPEDSNSKQIEENYLLHPDDLDIDPDDTSDYNYDDNNTLTDPYSLWFKVGIFWYVFFDLIVRSIPVIKLVMCINWSRGSNFRSTCLELSSVIFVVTIISNLYFTSLHIKRYKLLYPNISFFSGIGGFFVYYLMNYFSSFFICIQNLRLSFLNYYKMDTNDSSDIWRYDMVIRILCCLAANMVLDDSNGGIYIGVGFGVGLVFGVIDFFLFSYVVKKTIERHHKRSITERSEDENL